LRSLIVFLAIVEAALLIFVPNIPLGQAPSVFYVEPSSVFGLAFQRPIYASTEVPAQTTLNIVVTVPAQVSGNYVSVTNVLIYNDSEFNKITQANGFYASPTANIAIKPNTTVTYQVTSAGIYHFEFSGYQSQYATPAAFAVFAQPTNYLGIPFTQGLGFAVAAVLAVLTDAVAESRATTSKILLSRFRENGMWFLRIRCMEGTIDACTVKFDKTPLMTKDKAQPEIQMTAGEGANWMFWAADPPQNNDEREITVFDRGKRIFRRSFGELTETPA
jgi:hypothetical protein